MVDRKNKKDRARMKPIYIVSGGSGASGELIVETALAQFPEIQMPIIKMAYVRQIKQIKNVVAKVSKTGGTIVHTLVNSDIRETLIHLGKEHNLVTIDLMGTLLDRVALVWGQKPVGRPGLYRSLHHEYLDRIDAIEFAVAHDDGQKTQDLSSADIVLIGVSRCGKTPLSMYLAVHGWKVANVPLVIEFPPPEELFQIDHRRVIGLSIQYEHLMIHRKKRQERMGVALSTYTTSSSVLEELETARKICRKGGFHVVSVTDKPIETIADEISEYITHSVDKKPRKK